jgi:hypothetical protein
MRRSSISMMVIVILLTLLIPACSINRKTVNNGMQIRLRKCWHKASSFGSECSDLRPFGGWLNGLATNS